mgnify:CR=1 FL=1
MLGTNLRKICICQRAKTRGLLVVHILEYFIMLTGGETTTHRRSTEACSHGNAKYTRRVSRQCSEIDFNTPTATTEHVRKYGSTPAMINTSIESHKIPETPPNMYTDSYKRALYMLPHTANSKTKINRSVVLLI